FRGSGSRSRVGACRPRARGPFPYAFRAVYSAGGDPMTRTRAPLTLSLLLASLLPAGIRAQSSPPEPAATAARYFTENSMNVFRRFNGDGVKTLEFYGQVLGFGSIGAIGGVSRYQVGPSQLKFTRAANATFARGGIHDAAGVRLWTMWFPDEEALTKRFT